MQLVGLGSLVDLLGGVEFRMSSNSNKLNA